MNYLGLLAPLFIYSSFLMYRSPTIADSFVCLALALVPIVFYVCDRKYQKIEDDVELSKLKKQLEMDQLTARIEDLKVYTSKQRMRTDAEGIPRDNGKNFIF